MLTDRQTKPVMKVVVIGAGPAGLMAAEMLCGRDLDVCVFDAMPSPGRKFLMAGKSGLNITHAEPYTAFVRRYGVGQSFLKPLLDDFGPEELRQWVAALGIETFTGSSGKVFPVGMKAAPLLRAWLQRLHLAGVKFHMRHFWLGWEFDSAVKDYECADTGRRMKLGFVTPSGPVEVAVDAVVLALGGASWPRLGSTGAWMPYLQNLGVSLEPFRPSNCGFVVPWTEHFSGRFAGVPVKSVAASAIIPDGNTVTRRGEFVITRNGIEGSLVYALSSALRKQIEDSGRGVLTLDLLPDRDLEFLGRKLATPRGKNSLSSFLRKTTRLDGVKAALLREGVPDIGTYTPLRLAAAIKALPICLSAAAPIEKAISSAGGVALSELDDGLMLRRLPGVFCAGEMLAWDAPTGGYLLTACFSTGRRAGLGVIDWLRKQSVNIGVGSF